jgi:hypothetical protein
MGPIDIPSAQEAQTTLMQANIADAFEKARQTTNHKRRNASRLTAPLSVSYISWEHLNIWRKYKLGATQRFVNGYLAKIVRDKWETARRRTREELYY